MAPLVSVTVVRHLPEAARRDAEFHLARLVFDLAFDNVIHAAVVSHPSLLKPEDLDVRLTQTSSYTS
jgi:hypothetical protein